MEWKKQYEKEGYAVLENFLSASDIQELSTELYKLVQTMPPPEERTVFSTINSESKQNKNRYFLESADKIRYFYEDGALGENGALKVDQNVALNKIGHALHALDPVFKKHTISSKVVEVLKKLGFKDPAVVQSMIIFKNPGLGSEVQCHQDGSYLYTEPLNLIGFWYALEDAILENGCIHFLNGSHTGDLHCRYIRNPDKTSEELLIHDKARPNFEKTAFTPAPVKKGSCVLIHGKVLHFSEPNSSNKSRHAYTFHVVERDGTKWSEANWLQPTENQTFLSVYSN